MRIKKKEIKGKVLDQKIIDAYENYIWNVNEAVRFVKMGFGKPSEHIFTRLEVILKQHEEDLWLKMEEIITEKLTKPNKGKP